MNERIRELAQDAGLGFHGESITMLQDELPETVLGRFAELIVRECAYIGYDASYYECALNVSNKIKQHFGVE